MDEFSSRTRDIEQVKDRLVADYVESMAVPEAAVAVPAKATLETRPPRQQHSLGDLTAQWRARATEVRGKDAPTWAAALLAGRTADPLLRADDIPLDDLDAVAAVVVERVSDRRATWKRERVRWSV